MKKQLEKTLELIEKEILTGYTGARLSQKKYNNYINLIEIKKSILDYLNSL